MPSTVIARLNYNDETETLEICFISGAVYCYFRVPQQVYRALKAAKSKGTYFNRFIKEVYPFERRP